MSEMVRRVAKAIKAKDYERDNLCSEFDCEEFARAAIEAVAKGPTDEMKLAALTAMRKPRQHVSHTASDQAMTFEIGFTAAITAALSPSREDEGK